jgi:hypothetical protein
LDFPLCYGQEVLNYLHVGLTEPVVFDLVVVLGIVEGVVAIFAAEKGLYRVVALDLFEEG